MTLGIPEPLRIGHEALHSMRVAAAREAGAPGEVACELARDLDPGR